MKKMNLSCLAILLSLVVISTRGLSQEESMELSADEIIKKTQSSFIVGTGFSYAFSARSVVVINEDNFFQSKGIGESFRTYENSEGVRRARIPGGGGIGFSLYLAKQLKKKTYLRADYIRHNFSSSTIEDGVDTSGSFITQSATSEGARVVFALSLMRRNVFEYKNEQWISLYYGAGFGLTHVRDVALSLQGVFEIMELSYHPAPTTYTYAGISYNYKVLKFFADFRHTFGSARLATIDTDLPEVVVHRMVKRLPVSGIGGTVGLGVSF